MNEFKYHIVMNATLSKNKAGDKTEYASVYFNSRIKTVINLNFECSIDNSFQQILYKLDNWINEGSGWIIISINSQYLNICKYSPLLGSNYIKLPDKLNHPKSGLIDIKNKDNKCFLWCHVRHLNPLDDNSTRITRADKMLADDLDYSGITFTVCEDDYSDIEDKNSININVFSYDNNDVYPMYTSDKKFNDDMDLLLIYQGDKSHYVYIKDFDRLMFNKTKNKNKKHFCKRCLQSFSSGDVLIRRKENRLLINGTQFVKLGNGFIISIINIIIIIIIISRQIPVPFKIYADFECIVKETKSCKCDNNDEDRSCTKKYQKHIPFGFGYKVVCVDDRFSKDIVI